MFDTLRSRISRGLNSAEKIYVGAVGVDITLDAEIDISAATTHEIRYQKPDGTKGAWTATIVDDTMLQYITKAGDLDYEGEWKLQIYVELPALTGRGATVIMHVYEDFE